MGACCFSVANVCNEERGLPEDYDLKKSTEENHADASAPFVGPNHGIRPLLDYSYHNMYTPDRVEVQDKIIAEFIQNVHPRCDDMLPWVVFTAGAMGAGKGYVTEWMKNQGYFPVDHFVVIDPDEVRKTLPEWPAYVNREPEEAGAMTQKEAGLIAEIMGYVALRERLNVIFDGSLRNAEWYVNYFEKLRREFPGIRIMIVHVTADIDEVIERAAARAAKTGRAVPEKLLRESAEAVPRSVQTLASHADFVFRVVNSGETPQVAREEGAPFPPQSVALDWNLIKNLWKNIDLDGDGELSPEEVQIALAHGVITEAVIKSMDRNGDGCISREEVHRAEEIAKRSATHEIQIERAGRR